MKSSASEPALTNTYTSTKINLPPDSLSLTDDTREAACAVIKKELSKTNVLINSGTKHG